MCKYINGDFYNLTDNWRALNTKSIALLRPEIEQILVNHNMNTLLSHIILIKSQILLGNSDFPIRLKAVVVMQTLTGSGVPKGVGWFKPPPPPKVRSFDKAEQNSQFRGKYIRNNLIRKRVSLICKLSRTPD
jgi:hypothetical protein